MIYFPQNQFLFEFIADSSKNYNYELFGSEICQNQTSLVFLSRLLETYRPSTIIEIGTFTGGLSIHFGLYGFLKNISVHTWDIVDKRQNVDIFDRLNINFHLDDCFSKESDNIIKQLISNGPLLFFCDGGNKIKEFNYYSDLIKSGDIICCHDFALNDAIFNQNVYLKSWGWKEIDLNDVNEPINRNNLTLVDINVSSVAAMGAFIKR